MREYRSIIDWDDGWNFETFGWLRWLCFTGKRLVSRSVNSSNLLVSPNSAQFLQKHPYSLWEPTLDLQFRYIRTSSSSLQVNYQVFKLLMSLPGGNYKIRWAPPGGLYATSEGFEVQIAAKPLGHHGHPTAEQNVDFSLFFLLVWAINNLPLKIILTVGNCSCPRRWISWIFHCPRSIRRCEIWMGSNWRGDWYTRYSERGSWAVDHYSCRSWEPHLSVSLYNYFGFVWPVPEEYVLELLRPVYSLVLSGQSLKKMTEYVPCSQRIHYA